MKPLQVLLPLLILLVAGMSGCVGGEETALRIGDRYLYEVTTSGTSDAFFHEVIIEAEKPTTFSDGHVCPALIVRSVDSNSTGEISRYEHSICLDGSNRWSATTMFKHTDGRVTKNVFEDPYAFPGLAFCAIYCSDHQSLRIKVDSYPNYLTEPPTLEYTRNGDQIDFVNKLEGFLLDNRRVHAEYANTTYFFTDKPFPVRFEVDERYTAVLSRYSPGEEIVKRAPRSAAPPPPEGRVSVRGVPEGPSPFDWPIEDAIDRMSIEPRYSTWRVLHPYIPLVSAVYAEYRNESARQTLHQWEFVWQSGTMRFSGTCWLVASSVPPLSREVHDTSCEYLKETRAHTPLDEGLLPTEVLSWNDIIRLWRDRIDTKAPVTYASWSVFGRHPDAVNPESIAQPGYVVILNPHIGKLQTNKQSISWLVDRPPVRVMERIPSLSEMDPSSGRFFLTGQPGDAAADGDAATVAGPEGDAHLMNEQSSTAGGRFLRTWGGVSMVQVPDSFR